MKRLIIFALLFSLVACEKKPTEVELNIAFQVARVLSVDGAQIDSVIFSYNSDKELLQVEKFADGGLSHSVSSVNYTSDKIENWDGTYYKNETGQIIKQTYDLNSVEFKYQNELIYHEISLSGTIVTMDEFFMYEGSDLVKDSIVYHNQTDGKDYVTLYELSYTDSIIPHFVVDASGLFEMPLKSKKLIRFSESKEHHILNKFSYTISENELIRNETFYDTNPETERETWTTKYTYIDKNSRQQK